jgi:hypothetical protein
VFVYLFYLGLYSIGVWIALLRIMEDRSYQFAEELTEFPYFGANQLPVEYFGAAVE